MVWYSFTMVPGPGYQACYVWQISAQGRGSRRHLVTTVRVPWAAGDPPSRLLRLMADELDKPVLMRWQPR